MNQKLVKLGIVLMSATGLIATTNLTTLNTSALFETNKVDAYELIVDGETWFILEDIQQITKILDQFKAKMTPNISENIKVRSVDFVQDVEIVPVKVDKKQLGNIDNLSRKLNYPIQAQDVYVVQEGDSTWKIANTLNIPLEEIERMNPDVQLDKLWPNDKLVISAVRYHLDVRGIIESPIKSKAALSVMWNFNSW